VGKIEKSGKISHLSLKSIIYPTKRDERKNIFMWGEISTGTTS
jgi:hypothetical protein